MDAIKIGWHCSLFIYIFNENHISRKLYSHLKLEFGSTLPVVTYATTSYNYMDT